ncbi:hypothetical protein ST47_g6011 [Ascochyta rabiei]|uniref:Uncharacterized protein n=1 Tax=Didymella rabiei TaxID=5454 RepID=A0A163D1M5_DIDRA|nr:hypothetical protein ST47_g6011 [Ascochyta rabiei]
MAISSRDLVLTSIKGALTSGAYSDLAITCGSDTYNVHKVIVCPRADFFARAVKFGGEEAQTGTVNLPEDEPEVVELLVQYLYEGDYDPVLLPTEDIEGSTTSVRVLKKNLPSPPYGVGNYSYSFPHRCSDTVYRCDATWVCPHHECGRDYARSCTAFTCEQCTIPGEPLLPPIHGDASQLLVHTKIYEAADKYEVVGLKDLAKEKFARACKHFYDTPEFPIAAHYAFSTTPEDDKDLRDVVSATIAVNMGLVKKAEVKVLLTQFNGLALGILEQKIVENGW